MEIKSIKSIESIVAGRLEEFNFCRQIVSKLVMQYDDRQHLGLHLTTTRALPRNHTDLIDGRSARISILTKSQVVIKYSP
jgi:hypothetical protein